MKQKYVFVASISLISILLDQLSKFIIKQWMGLQESISILPGVFHLTYVHNTGAGFGILKDQTLLLILISLGVIFYIRYKIREVDAKDRLLQLSLAFILGGAIGNLIDRVFLGYVIDFLDFQIWPIFNLADSFLTIGVIVLVWWMWKHDK